MKQLKKIRELANRQKANLLWVLAMHEEETSTRGINN